MNRLLVATFVSVVALVATSCSSAYYSTMEKFGVDKRDILVDRIEDARDDQEDARDQFVSTLDAFKAVAAFDGGDLEDLYDDLQSRYSNSVDDAESVRSRITSVEKVAGDLFTEWEEEADSISDPGLRSESRSLLRQTQDSYGKMLASMQRAERRMDPVLNKFRDHVLFLKHNLNARAVASLQSQLSLVRTDVDALIADMEDAIREADRFIDDLD